MGELKLEDFDAVASPGATADGLEEARDIIVAQTYLAAKIPDALRLAKPEDTAHALRPAVETCVAESVRRQPEVFAEALFPVLMPAFRRIVTDALQRFIVAIDEVISISFTREGILWRWEAFRCGRPFSEVVLRHTLLFRVDDVLLVHQPSGVLLTSVTRGHRQHMDQIAGMLTAIRDFGTDALSVKKGESLKKIEYGDRAILMEGVHEVSLAVVVRGSPPREFQENLMLLRERILDLYGEAIRNFRGDVSRFASCDDLLELCLVERSRRTSSRVETIMRRSRIRSTLIALTLICVISAFAFSYARLERQASKDQSLRDYVDLLAKVPGVVVLQTSETGDGYEVKILKDHMANPAVIPIPEGFRLHETPFISADPEIIKTKLSRVLDPPPGVYWSFAHGILSLHGVASRAWVAQAVDRARTIPGVHVVETRQLETRDAD